MALRRGWGHSASTGTKAESQSHHNGKVKRKALFIPPPMQHVWSLHRHGAEAQAAVCTVEAQPVCTDPGGEGRQESSFIDLIQVGTKTV